MGCQFQIDSFGMIYWKKPPLKGIEAVAAKAAYGLLMHCWR